MQYIGGRQSDSALPLAGGPIDAERVQCDESGQGHTSTSHVVAREIRGIPVADAVAGPTNELMLSERLWRVIWTDLPTALQPYVARSVA